MPDTFWYSCADPTYKPLAEQQQQAVKEIYDFSGIPKGYSPGPANVDCGAGRIATVLEADFGNVDYTESEYALSHLHLSLI